MKVTGASPFTIPITNMSVSATPYSGIGRLAVMLHDGNHRFRLDGWHTRVTISWGEVSAADNLIIQNMILDVIGNAGLCTIDVDLENVGTKVLSNHILENVTAIQAVFGDTARSRPGSLSFVARDLVASPPTWMIL